MGVYDDIKTGLEQAIAYETLTHKASIADCLTVTYDCSLPDAPTLCVGRIMGDDVRVLNVFHGDKAFGIYALLTGYAEWRDNNGRKKV